MPGRLSPRRRVAILAATLWIGCGRTVSIGAMSASGAASAVMAQPAPSADPADPVARVVGSLRSDAPQLAAGVIVIALGFSGLLLFAALGRSRPIEIMRGCTRGCRFCHAGMVTRPVRERSVEEVVDAVEEAIAQTGFEEIALLSLSSSDYTYVVDLVKAVGARFAGLHLSISLPSLRIETASAELMEALKDNKRGGFTFAPEAATERMRNIINKPVAHQEVLDAAHAVYSRGWRTIKLYFMIGHPAETLEDVQAIADLSKTVLNVGRKSHGRKASVNIGVSTFIPKPHTPFHELLEAMGSGWALSWWCESAALRSKGERRRKSDHALPAAGTAGRRGALHCLWRACPAQGVFRPSLLMPCQPYNPPA